MLMTLKTTKSCPRESFCMTSRFSALSPNQNVKENTFRRKLQCFIFMPLMFWFCFVLFLNNVKEISEFRIEKFVFCGKTQHYVVYLFKQNVSWKVFPPFLHLLGVL